jgi:hypothetical protein
LGVTRVSRLLAGAEGPPQPVLSSLAGTEFFRRGVFQQLVGTKFFRRRVSRQLTGTELFRPRVSSGLLGALRERGTPPAEVPADRALLFRGKMGLMGTKKKPNPSPAPKLPAPPKETNTQIAEFAKSYERVEARAKALEKNALLLANVDIQVAATVALGVARHVRGSKRLLTGFKKLAETGLFPADCLEDTEDTARAAWYARHQLLLFSSLDQPPGELAQTGFALRARMLRVIEYNLEDDADIAARVATIRQGGGYLDLANDLVALATIYTTRQKELSLDRKRYVPEDSETAEAIASRLLTHLGTADRKKTDWAEMQGRCWTLLQGTYEQVRRGGLFLTWGTEEERHFPSLVAASRSQSTTAGKIPPPPPPSP